MNQSKTDILDALTRTAEAIAQTFGDSCETLIHDMTQPGHPIIAIYNGHVSGRKTGSTADIFGDDSHSAGKPTHFKSETDIVNTLVVTKTGRYVKSTTVNYIGEGYHYALGINFDYTSLNNAMSTLNGLINIGGDLREAIDSSVNTQLEELFSDCLSVVGKPAENRKKNDRLQLIALLMQKNAFSFQKSITYVAERLGVSRYTIYKYCHEIEENSQL